MINEKFDLITHLADTKGKHIGDLSIDGEYVCFDYNVGAGPGTEEVIYFSKVLFNGSDITALFNHIDEDWPNSFTRHITDLCVDHCRQLFRSETNEHDYTLENQ
jgi:hypothetical protein